MAPPPGSPHGSEFAVPHQPGGSPGYPAYAHPAGPTSAAAGAGRDATGRVSWSALKPNPSVSSRHSGGSAPGTDDSQPPLPPLPVQHTGSSYGTATPAPGAPSQTPPPPGYTYDGKPMPMNTMYPQHTGPYPPSQQLPGHYPPHAGHYPPPQQYGPPMGHMGYPQQHVMPQQQQPRAVPPQPAEGGQKAELVGSDGQKKDNQFIAELE